MEEPLIEANRKSLPVFPNEARQFIRERAQEVAAKIEQFELARYRTCAPSTGATRPKASDTNAAPCVGSLNPASTQTKRAPSI